MNDYISQIHMRYLVGTGAVLKQRHGVAHAYWVSWWRLLFLLSCGSVLKRFHDSCPGI